MFVNMYTVITVGNDIKIASGMFLSEENKDLQF